MVYVLSIKFNRSVIKILYIKPQATNVTHTHTHIYIYIYIIKIVKNPGNGRLNNLNDPVLNVLRHSKMFAVLPCQNDDDDDDDGDDGDDDDDNGNTTTTTTTNNNNNVTVIVP